MDAFDRGAASVARDAVLKARAALDLMQPDSSWLDLTRRVDPARMIRMLRNENFAGPEREVTLELDKRQQRAEGNSCWLPWETLAYRSARARMNQTRADVVGSTTAGGYLVATLNFPTAAAALMSMLVLGRLGATAIEATGANLTLPKVTGSATPMWLTTETTQVTEVEQTFGQLALNPHTVGGYTELSHLLTLQSRPDAGDVVALDLARKLQRAVDAAGIGGSGSAGQPQGLIGLSGVAAVAGATYALATGMTAIGDTGDALEFGSNPGWAAARSVAILLRQRQEFSGSSFTLWRGGVDAGSLHDLPAFSTSGVGSGVAVFGNWYYYIVANWSGGLEISVNPYANFQQGIIGMRCLATLDLNTVWPGAFSVVSGIT